MPRGLIRYYGAGHLHFITCSCYHRQPILGTPQRRDLLLKVLEQVRERYCLVILGYVVMPEHFHLLITEPQKGTPSTVMQALKLGFARRVLAGALRTRPITYGSAVSTISMCGPSASASRSSATYTANPVNRGLVEEPDQWQRSSFRSYASAEVGQVCINDCQLLKMKIRSSAA